jgi:ferritin
MPMKKPIKLGSDIVAALESRLADEFKAFYFYRAAANWCRDRGFDKAASFFQAESDTELTHAKTIENYIVDWNVLPGLDAIKSAAIDFKGLIDIIEKAYQIEYDLYEAYEETSAGLFTKDLCTFDFLQQFRKIQTESVAEYATMLNILEGVEDEKFELLMLQDKLFA